MRDQRFNSCSLRHQHREVRQKEPVSEAGRQPDKTPAHRLKPAVPPTRSSSQPQFAVRLTRRLGGRLLGDARAFPEPDQMNVSTVNLRLLPSSRVRGYCYAKSKFGTRARSASSANLNGFLTPLIIASIIRRPLRPMMSLITESSLMLASSSVF
jgi:hypothetical protein